MRYTYILSKLKQLHPIDASIVNSLYTLSEKSLLTAIVFSIILSIALYSQLSYNIVLWMITLVVVSLVRLYYSYIYKTNPDLYSVKLWYKKFIILAFITGFIVSVLGFGFIHYLNDYYQLFVLASLLGLTAGATISLSSDFRIAIAYISIIILPLIVSTAMQNTSLNFILSILLVLFYISQIIMIFKNYAQEEKIKDLTVNNENLLAENKQFIADMVHQIRTPLTVIMANTSLLEMKYALHDSSYVKTDKFSHKYTFKLFWWKLL